MLAMFHRLLPQVGGELLGLLRGREVTLLALANGGVSGSDDRQPSPVSFGLIQWGVSRHTWNVTESTLKARNWPGYGKTVARRPMGNGDPL